MECTELSYFLESHFRTNDLAAYSALGESTLAEGGNPVNKIQLIISGNEGNLYITYLDDGENDADGVEGNVAPQIINCTNDNNIGSAKPTYYTPCYVHVF